MQEDINGLTSYSVYAPNPDGKFNHYVYEKHNDAVKTALSFKVMRPMPIIDRVAQTVDP